MVAIPTSGAPFDDHSYMNRMGRMGNRTVAQLPSRTADVEAGGWSGDMMEEEEEEEEERRLTRWNKLTKLLF